MSVYRVDNGAASMFANNSNGAGGAGGAVCETAADTAAKEATFNNYVLQNGNRFALRITTANTSASALTLNVNNTGAKSIYINGEASSSTNYTLPAGDYTVYYDGTNYYIRTDGGLDATNTLTSESGVSTTVIPDVTLIKDGSVAADKFTIGSRKSGETSGSNSLAQGTDVTASASNTLANGTGTIAGYANQVAVGKYNDNKSDTLLEVGKGTGTSARSNAFEVYSDGHAAVAGRLEKGSSDAFPAASNLATVEATNTATAQHAARSYVYVKSADTIYKIGNTACPAGQSISSYGTATKIGDVLTSLNSDLTSKLDVGSIKSCSKSSLASGNNFIAYPSGFNRDNSIIIAIAINDIVFHPIDTYLQLANMDVNNVVCSPTTAGIGAKVTFWLLKYA